MAKPNLLIYLSHAISFLPRKDILKTTLVLFFFLNSICAFADMNFYPADFANQIQSHSLKNETLINALNSLLTTNHQKNATGNDTLGCATIGSAGCYTQTVLGYNGARLLLFGKIFLKKDTNGNYITDVYCQKHFGESAGIGPNVIPEANKINCEHTWPQSKFSKAYPNEMQKSDLHHLFPADSKGNSIRGNNDFTDVSNDTGELAKAGCGTSKFGSSATSSGQGFEAPLTHKGNIARALFYFSVRYKISIPKNEEDVLRRWNDLDPVDQEELDRNEAIQQVQGNRNPFIDFPGLANDINKF